jgi:hypothetical protein
MNKVSTKDGVESFYKDWARGQPMTVAVMDARPRPPRTTRAFRMGCSLPRLTRSTPISWLL